MSEIKDGDGVSLEFWPNGSRVTACRAWLHEGDAELLELDERKLASQAERQEILNGLPATVSSPIRQELARILAEAAIAVLDVQARARAVKDAKGPTPPKLDEDPQWEDPVDGAALLDEVLGHLTAYIVFPSKEAGWAVALWVLMTHAHNANDFSPLLLVASPVRSSGKSRLLEVIYFLVRRPWKNLSPSDAVLYHKIEREHPTLLVDEVDNTDWRNRAALVALLNGGFSKMGAVVSRMFGEGAGMEPRDFSVWTPKALATKGLKGIPDTTLSRSVVIHMKRKKKSDGVTRFRERKVRASLSPVRAKLAKWAADRFDDLVGAEPATLETISDRAADAWSPLLAIGEAVGGAWSERARQAAATLNGEGGEAHDLGEQLLADIRRVFVSDKLFSADLVKALVELEASPWADWKGGRAGFTATTLASLLDSFFIDPRQIKIGETSKKGYHLVQFHDVWERYLPQEPAPNRNSETSVDAKGVTGNFEGETGSPGFGAENGSKTLQDTGSFGVSAENRATREDAEIRVEPCAHSGRGQAPGDIWQRPDGAWVCGWCHPNPRDRAAGAA